MADEPKNAPDAVVDAAPPADVEGTEPGKGIAMRSAIQQSLDKFKADGGFSSLEKQEEVETQEADEDAPESQDEPTPEPGETGEDDEEAPESQEVEGVEADDEEAGEEDTPEPLVVEVPGRRAGEKLEIEAPDEETADVLRMLANNGMRREEFNRQIEPVRAMKQEVDAFTRRLEIDPSGLILERAKPETQRQIVRDVLLSNPELMQEIADELSDITLDPNSMRRAVAEMERDKALRSSQVQNVNAIAERNAQLADQITQAVNNLVPEGADEKSVNDFLLDAFEYLESIAFTRGPEGVNPNTVPDLLQSRLRLYGLADASPGSTGPGNGAAPAASPTRPAARLRKAEPSELESAKETGKKLTAESRRKKAAITAPAGAGTSTATTKFPTGQTVKQRMAHLRKHGTGLKFGA